MGIKKTKINKVLKIVGIALLNFFPLLVLAQNQSYTLLAPLPGLDQTYTPQGFGKYVNGMIELALVLGALLAVIFLVVGGVKYMTGEALDKKSEGIDQMKGAIFGLLILCASFLILKTINPAILDFKLDIRQVNVPSSQTGSAQNLSGSQLELQRAGYNTQNDVVPPERMTIMEARGPKGSDFRARCKNAFGIQTEASYNNQTGSLECLSQNSPLESQSSI